MNAKEIREYCESREAAGFPFLTMLTSGELRDLLDQIDSLESRLAIARKALDHYGRGHAAKRESCAFCDDDGENARLALSKINLLGNASCEASNCLHKQTSVDFDTKGKTCDVCGAYQRPDGSWTK